VSADGHRSHRSQYFACFPSLREEPGAKERRPGRGSADPAPGNSSSGGGQRETKGVCAICTFFILFLWLVVRWVFFILSYSFSFLFILVSPQKVTSGCHSSSLSSSFPQELLETVEIKTEGFEVHQLEKLYALLCQSIYRHRRDYNKTSLIQVSVGLMISPYQRYSDLS